MADYKAIQELDARLITPEETIADPATIAQMAEKYGIADVKYDDVRTITAEIGDDALHLTLPKTFNASSSLFDFFQKNYVGKKWSAEVVEDDKVWWDDCTDDDIQKMTYEISGDYGGKFNVEGDDAWGKGYCFYNIDPEQFVLTLFL